MPKCPKVSCDKIWQWDWCADHYREKTTGGWAEMKTIFQQDPEKETEIRVDMYQCKCGLILGFQCLDPLYGGPIFNHPDWEGTDWEDDLNSYK